MTRATETARAALIAGLFVLGMVAAAPGGMGMTDDAETEPVNTGTSEDPEYCAIHPVTREGYCHENLACVLIFLVTSEPPCDA